MNLGIYILILNSQDFKEKNESDKIKMTSDIFEKLSLSADKAEKDIGIYKSSISKMEQAKELIEELRIKDKEKNPKKLITIFLTFFYLSKRHRIYKLQRML